MEELPWAPEAAELRRRLDPEIRTLPTGTELWRLYLRGGTHPRGWKEFRRFGPVASARFDHHLSEPPAESEWGILYAALSVRTCVAEVFQEERTIHRAEGLPYLVAFGLARDLKLLDLSGLWPTRAGASMTINSGPRARARSWSRAIYGAYPEAQGLYYCSSMDANRPAVALYERAAPALSGAPSFHRPLTEPALLTPLRRIARELGYDLV